MKKIKNSSLRQDIYFIAISLRRGILVVQLEKPDETLSMLFLDGNSTCS